MLAQPAHDARGAFRTDVGDAPVPVEVFGAKPELQFVECADAHDGKALRDACVEPDLHGHSGVWGARADLLQPLDGADEPIAQALAAASGAARVSLAKLRLEACNKLSCSVKVGGLLRSELLERCRHLGLRG